MAIVKTTQRESEGGSQNGEQVELEKPLDRTKSVVNQGGRPTARAPRQSGMVHRPAPIERAPGSLKEAVRGFFRDTQGELRRVVWPDKVARVSGTIVTLLMLTFFSLYIFGLDSLMRVFFIALGILPENANR